MKKFFLLILLLILCSCKNYVDKPKDLLSQNKMAEIMADMSLNDQSTTINPTSNLELGTRFILKKHNIKADNFISSYRYYVVTKKISAVIVKSQTIIKGKNPEAEEYIDKKLKENSPLPTISR